MTELKKMELIGTSQFAVRKSIPPLVERGLIKHIAKINNIDMHTGNELAKPPSEFQLLCSEIKNSTLRCVRENWIFITILIIISIMLYYRYQTVKRRKKQLNKFNNKILNDIIQ